MKKKVLILCCCLVVFLAFSIIAVAQVFGDNMQELFDFAEKTKNVSEDSVVAIVNGEKIYSETIDFLMEAQKISQSNMGADRYSEDVSEEDVLNKQIRNIVIQQEAEKSNLVASYDEAYQNVLTSYNILKNKNDENYRFLLKYMEEMEFTEEEYLNKAAKSYQKTMTSANLYSEFIKDKEGTTEQLREEYEAFIDSLIDNADIKYK